MRWLLLAFAILILFLWLFPIDTGVPDFKPSGPTKQAPPGK